MRQFIIALGTTAGLAAGGLGGIAGYHAYQTHRASDERQAAAAAATNSSNLSAISSEVAAASSYSSALSSAAASLEARAAEAGAATQQQTNGAAPQGPSAAASYLHFACADSQCADVMGAQFGIRDTGLQPTLPNCISVQRLWASNNTMQPWDGKAGDWCSPRTQADPTPIERQA